MIHVQKTWLPWKQCIQEIGRGCVHVHVCVCVCVRLIRRDGKICVFEGASDISPRHDWNKGGWGGVFQSVCANGKEGGEGYRRGCLSVLVDPAGDCSQIQLIPTGCFHLSSTSDEEKKRGKKSREPWGTVFSVYQFMPDSTRDIGNYFHPSICQEDRVVCSFPLTCRAG